ncbi:gastrula zinc finger protein XlCGF48.2-like isoform X1 [Argonauta hians]
MVYEQAYLDQDHGSHAMTILSELWKKQTLCDATVQAGAFKIKVHKTVLMVASPTLLALCQNGPCDGHLDVHLPINLRAVDGLHCFIMYLYEGILNLSEESVMEVLNIASYLQVETVVKFCLSFLDSAKEQNIVLKAALSSPYDTCLYKVLNESLSKSSEANSTKTSNWVYQPDSTSTKAKVIHKPAVCLSQEQKDKSIVIESKTFCGNSFLSSSSSLQVAESSFSKNIHEASNNDIHMQYDDIENEIKPNIESPNPSNTEEFVVLEMQNPYTFSQNNNHSSPLPPSNSNLLELKDTDDTVIPKVQHSDLIHNKPSGPLLDQIIEEDQNNANHSDPVSFHQEVLKQAPVLISDDDDATEEILSPDLSGDDHLSSEKKSKEPHVFNTNNLIEIELESSSSPTVYDVEESDSQEKMVIGQIGSTVSSEKVDFICTLCHTSFLCAEIVVSHLKHEHNVPLDDIPEFVLVGNYFRGEDRAINNSCIECGFSSERPEYLPYHRYFQHGVPLPRQCTLFKCQSCNAEFFQKRGLTDHCQQTHKEEQNMCKQCGRAYKFQTCLQKHIYNCHTSKRKCSCVYCGRSFKKQDHLRVHIRLHTHEKPFACHVCNYKSTTKGNLKAHLMRRHSIDIDTVEPYNVNKNKPSGDISL